MNNQISDKSSFFPMLIQYTDTGERQVLKTPMEVELKRSFTIIECNYKMNPKLTYIKNGKRVVRCRKTRAGDWNYLTLSLDNFLWSCVVGKHAWTPVTERTWPAVITCFENATGLEII